MITKNRQSDETITAMAKKAFPDKTAIRIKELTEGMCNVTAIIREKAYGKVYRRKQSGMGRSV